VQIYYQSTSFLRFTIIVDSQPADADIIAGQYQVFATVKKIPDGTIIISDEATDRESLGVYLLTLPPSKTSTLGRYQVTWTYTVSGVTNTRTTFYEVVVAHVTASEIRSEVPELANKTDDEIYRKERLARQIIETYCNQRFTFELGKTYKVLGTGRNTLLLPNRIFTLTSVKAGADTVEDITAYVEIHDDYHLRWAQAPWGVDLAREFFDTYLFKKNEVYRVTGDWGWQYVPEEVKLATIYLIKDYFTDDYVLRQHGIISANIGDESYRFADELWPSTGNVDVDALLSNYVRPRVEVI
jgi:hypothetical protein